MFQVCAEVSGVCLRAALEDPRIARGCCTAVATGTMAIGELLFIRSITSTMLRAIACLRDAMRNCANNCLGKTIKAFFIETANLAIFAICFPVDVVLKTAYSAAVIAVDLLFLSLSVLCIANNRNIVNRLTRGVFGHLGSVWGNVLSSIPRACSIACHPLAPSPETNDSGVFISPALWMNSSGPSIFARESGSSFEQPWSLPYGATAGEPYERFARTCNLDLRMGLGNRPRSREPGNLSEFQNPEHCVTGQRYDYLLRSRLVRLYEPLSIEERQQTGKVNFDALFDPGQQASSSPLTPSQVYDWISGFQGQNELQNAMLDRRKQRRVAFAILPILALASQKPSFREKLIAIIVSSDTCADATAQQLNSLQALAETELATCDEEVNRALYKHAVLRCIKIAATEIANTRGNSHEIIEVELKLAHLLKRSYGIQLSTERMTYEGCANLRQDEIIGASQTVQAFIPERFKELRTQWITSKVEELTDAYGSAAQVKEYLDVTENVGYYCVDGAAEELRDLRQAGSEPCDGYPGYTSIEMHRKVLNFLEMSEEAFIALHQEERNRMLEELPHKQLLFLSAYVEEGL